METAFAAVSTNQCRVLEGAIKDVEQWVEMWRKPVKIWSLCEYRGLPEPFVQDMCRISRAGQALIKECTPTPTPTPTLTHTLTLPLPLPLTHTPSPSPASAPTSPAPARGPTSPASYMWLRIAVVQQERKEEFSLVLERFSQALRSFVTLHYEEEVLLEGLAWLKGFSSILRCIHEAEVLLERLDWLHSVKLVDEAAKDRMALLEKMQTEVSSLHGHDKNAADVARFLLAVLKAENFDAWKEASRVYSADVAEQERLGEGSYGKVFEATWKGLVSKIAVKKNEFKEIHDVELDALFKARHANVVRVFGWSAELLLLELMESNLDSFIEGFNKGGASWSLPLSISIDILLQVARGMAYLHEKEIVHRDLKPANILLDKWPSTLTPQEANYNLRLKIADFGTSRTHFNHVTLATARVGTSVYRAPEILHGDNNDKAKYGLQVDTYSFGMVCYKVLTGCDPNAKEILDRLQPEIRASSDCPEALISLVMQCCHKDPHMRPSFSKVYDSLVSIKYRGLITTMSKPKDAIKAVDQTAFAAVSTNQCRLLKAVIKAVDRWVEMWRKPVKIWDQCEYSCLSEPFVQEMCCIRSTGQALIKECITSHGSYTWLRMAVLREERTEEFSLVLERFSQALHSFVKVNDEAPQTHSSVLKCIHNAKVLFEGLDLLRFVKVNHKCILEAKVLLEKLDSLRSGKLVDEAAKDRRNLMALLEKVIGATPLHEKDTVDKDTVNVARFLLNVLKADNFNAWKEASQVYPADFVDEKRLGEGSYGEVFEATWKGSKIAVKENKFMELPALFTARHANVVRVFGWSSESPSLLLLERMEGNLDSFIEGFNKGGASRRLPLSISINILLQVARGMAYLHERTIVHGDLKPSNILLNNLTPHEDHYNLTLKIADFGTSRIHLDLTTLATDGTSVFRAPEIMHGDNDDKASYGLKVDIYSFGMVCYKVLTGCDPELRPEEIFKELCPEIRDTLDWPEALISLMMRCLHENPQERPSFSEVYDILILIKYRGLITTTTKDIAVRTLPGVAALVLLLITTIVLILFTQSSLRFISSSLFNNLLVLFLLAVFNLLKSLIGIGFLSLPLLTFLVTTISFALLNLIK